MAKIYAPNKEYNGVSAGVRFCNGVGETNNPHLEEWFKVHGYTVEKPQEKEAPEEEKEALEETKPPSKKTSKKAGD